MSDFGWREFIRASYGVDCGFRIHSGPATSVTPVDYTIKTTRSFSYTYHIERLPA